MTRTPKGRRRPAHEADEQPSKPAGLRPDIRGGDAADGTARVLVVDRREGRTLVLIADDGATVEVPAARLAKDCRREGAVLRVPTDAHANLRWADAVRDHAEEARRREDLSRRVERLRRSDPGGDVVL